MDKELFWDKKNAVDKRRVYAQTAPVDIHRLIHRQGFPLSIFFGTQAC
jgi:hypothetical protein